MAFEKFTKKPLKDRLKDTGFLLKNSFTIIGKDKDIKTPTIHMTVLTSIIIIFIYASILSFITAKFILLGIGLLLFTIFILLPFRFFYNVRQKADQSWIVYNTICGKDISRNDAHKHTKSEKGKLRIIAIVDFLIKFASSQRGRGGIAGVLINIFLGFLKEVWDLLSHYMLPAIVIEQKPLKEIIPEIKALKNNVPATLMGVFGIDFVGSVVGTLFWGIFIFAFILSVGVGYLVSMFTEVTVLTFGAYGISWVPPFLTLFVVSLIGGAYKRSVESIKVIYFTIFYTSIMRPMNIAESMRTELTNYLLMKPSDFAPQQQHAPQDQYIAKLATYIKQYQQKGYTEQQIKTFLLSKKYKEADIDAAIKFK